jgi:hypothetical protein
MSEQSALFFMDKTASGLRRMIIISSNAFKDRDHEWVSKKALEDYVKDFTGNDLLMWHRGDKVGEIVSAQMMGAFLVEVAQELPDRQVDISEPGGAPMITSVKAIWDAIERNPDIWGASIGFRYKAGDLDDAVYESIKKYETSLLPVEHAANPLTFARIIKE